MTSSPTITQTLREQRPCLSILQGSMGGAFFGTGLGLLVAVTITALPILQAAAGGFVIGGILGGCLTAKVVRDLTKAPREMVEFVAQEEPTAAQKKAKKKELEEARLAYWKCKRKEHQIDPSNTEALKLPMENSKKAKDRYDALFKEVYGE